MSNRVDVWLRGPVKDMPPLLTPLAYAFLQVKEDLQTLCNEMDQRLTWESPGDVAPVGFHLKHIAGATDRLLTYARGEDVSEHQIAAMKREKDRNDTTLTELAQRAQSVLDSALQQLRITDVQTLTNPREVGRAKLPSTVFGLLFHAAEHAQRHLGQLTTTAKLLSSTRGL